MSALTKTASRNQSMEVCKLIASVFVILIHVPLPGKLGSLMACVGRFAVPVFFAISGYFSYNVGWKKLNRRLVHIVLLNIAAIGVCLLWGCIHAYSQGENIWLYLLAKLDPKAGDLAVWFVLQVNPFSGHLWYLTAIFLCYGALWLYVRFFGEEAVNYTPLYIFSLGLITFHIALGEMTIATGTRVSHELVRNFVFFGLPMFSLGIFLRQYQEQILTNFNLNGWKLAGLTALGALLSVLQWYGMGSGELPIGMLLLVPALMLWMASHPTLTGNAFLGRTINLFGGVSTWVYITHLVVYDAYNTYLGWRFDWLSVPKQELLATAFVTAVTLIGCFMGQIWGNWVRFFLKPNRRAGS